MLARIGGERGAVAQAQNARGQDTGQLAKAFGGGQEGGVVVGSHGTSPRETPTAASALRPERCLAGSGQATGPIDRAFQFEFELTHGVPSEIGVVTGRGLVTRETESFAARVSGCERNHHGFARTPNAL